MKILKFILIGIVAIIATFLVIGLFLKKDYTVERSITINQPIDSVFNYIKFLKNQDNFSVWAKIDPNMKKEFRGEDATVGFVSAWDSEVEEAGKGEQEIKKISPNERIDYELRFIKPFESKAEAYLKTEIAGENATKVTWCIHGDWKYPMNVMQLFMNMDEMLGKDLSGGLANLKKLLN